MRENWYRSENELDRLRQAGVDDGVVDAAVSAFILGRRGQFGGIYTQYNKWIARNSEFVRWIAGAKTENKDWKVIDKAWK